MRVVLLAFLSSFHTGMRAICCSSRSTFTTSTGSSLSLPRMWWSSSRRLRLRLLLFVQLVRPMPLFYWDNCVGISEWTWAIVSIDLKDLFIFQHIEIIDVGMKWQNPASFIQLQTVWQHMRTLPSALWFRNFPEGLPCCFSRMLIAFCYCVGVLYGNVSLHHCFLHNHWSICEQNNYAKSLRPKLQASNFGWDNCWFYLSYARTRMKSCIAAEFLLNDNACIQGTTLETPGSTLLHLSLLVECARTMASCHRCKEHVLQECNISLGPCRRVASFLFPPSKIKKCWDALITTVKH